MTLDDPNRAKSHRRPSYSDGRVSAASPSSLSDIHLHGEQLAEESHQYHPRDELHHDRQLPEPHAPEHGSHHRQLPEPRTENIGMQRTLPEPLDEASGSRQRQLPELHVEDSAPHKRQLPEPYETSGAAPVRQRQLPEPREDHANMHRPRQLPDPHVMQGSSTAAAIAAAAVSSLVGYTDGQHHHRNGNQFVYPDHPNSSEYHDSAYNQHPEYRQIPGMVHCLSCCLRND